MKGEHRTKAQLLEELARLRQHIADLETSQDDHKQTLEALRQAQAEVEQLFNAAVPLWAIDIDHNVLRVNDAFCSFFGMRREEVLGAKCDQIWRGPVCNTPDCPMAKVLGGAEQGEYELDRQLPDGNTVSCAVTAVPYRGPDGELIGIVENFSDMTERKLVLEALRESESRSKSVFESRMVGILFWDVNGDITDANDAFLEMVGYGRDELLSGAVHWRDMTPPEYTDQDDRALAEITATGAMTPIEKEYIRKDGSRIPILLGAASLPGPAFNGVAFVLDITERKKADEEIIRQAAVLQAINDVFREALTCETDEELGKTCLSVAEKLTGSKFGFFAELNAKGLLDDIAISNPGWDACKMAVADARRYIKDMPVRGIDRTTVREGKSRIVNRDQMATHPDRVGTPEGHPEITSFLGVPLKHQGKTIGMIGLGNKEGGYAPADQEAVESLAVAVVEVLRTKRAEEEVRKHRDHLEELVEERAAEIRRVQERFTGLYESSKDAIGWADLEGKLFDVNDAFCKLTGYSREELLGGKKYQEITPREYHEYEAEKIKHIVETGEPQEYEKEYIRKDGSRVPILLTVFFVKGAEGQAMGVAAIIKDITERKQAEDAMKKSSEELQKVVNLMAGREVRMAELKKAIRKLREQLDSAGLAPVADDPLKEKGKAKR